MCRECHDHGIEHRKLTETTKLWIFDAIRMLVFRADFRNALPLSAQASTAHHLLSPLNANSLCDSFPYPTRLLLRSILLHSLRISESTGSADCVSVQIPSVRVFADGIRNALVCADSVSIQVMGSL